MVRRERKPVSMKGKLDHKVQPCLITFHESYIIKTCLPTINSISTMIRHDIVGVRKEKVILIAPGFIDDLISLQWSRCSVSVVAIL